MPPKRSKASSFPAARIKRIMQQDDDIGKVAGASPLVTSKAVELFLQDMVLAMEKEARQKGTRKVNLHHVKRAVLNTPSLDFLKDLVATIPDPTGPEEDDGEASTPKQRKPRGPNVRRAEQGGSSVAGTSRNGSVTAKQEYGASPPVSQQPHSLASTSQTQHGHGASYPSSSTAPSYNQPRVSIPISSLLGPSDEQEVGQSTPHFASNGGSAKMEDEDDDYEEETGEEEDSKAPQGRESAASVPALPTTRTDLAEDADYDED